MKTCKDCIYYFTDPGVTPMTPHECRLYPEAIKVSYDYWCGQLKEKVHVISDFAGVPEADRNGG